ncbi:hypothetical protein DIJ64_13720 [Mycobacterium leprae]|uniref:Uncharacterized protein n=1 Tax=Mycobacterium leprae TaxID=1769 RepID=A0AAD0KXC7_MYCLR|nr:hypothetical protein DIJ64_13720 [Mycobacterium leprae]
MNKEAISGPSLGIGAWSFALEGRRPVGSWTIGAGAGIVGGTAGGKTLASGMLQGIVLAGGAKPTATMSPAATADAATTVMIRRNADMPYLPGGRTSRRRP